MVLRRSIRDCSYSLGIRVLFGALLISMWSVAEFAHAQHLLDVTYKLLHIKSKSAAQMEPAGLLRAGDCVWEVSTRSLPDCFLDASDYEFSVHQWLGCGWTQSSTASLLQESQTQAMRTIIYVHGNWMPPSDARTRGLLIYDMLQRRSVEPIRLILFSWPSEQRERPARDVVAKKPLLAANANYLASFMGSLPTGSPDGLLGYSFGGAIVSGALHLREGGCIDGRAIQGETDVEFPPIRVSLVAPAFDRRDLNSGGHYDRALDGIDKLVNLYNSRDPILRKFRFSDRNTAPVAAGFAGLSVTRATSPLNANDKLIQYDCSTVGRSHWEKEYFKCPCFGASLDNLLGK